MQQLLSKVRSAVQKYDMIEDGDRIAVGVSGGKDSLALLCALARLRQFYPKNFELEAISIDPQFEGKPNDWSGVEKLCKEYGVNYTVKYTELWEIVFDVRKETNPCSLCSKMRKGALNDAAKELGCNKVALGHHLDDAAITFYMNLFQSGTIGSFQPVSYLSRKELYMIRPLILANEKEIIHVQRKYDLPVVKSRCAMDGNSERQRVSDIVAGLEKIYPQLKYKTLGAMQRGDISGYGIKEGESK